MLLAISVKELPSTSQYMITSRCHYCKVEHQQFITTDQWYRWQENGEYIQDVFPHLTDSQREMLLTGTHPECWEKMFPQDEEEDDDHSSI